MHKTSLQYMNDAFDKHASARPVGKVLDVGASTKKMGYRNIWEEGGWTYHGLNLVDGDGIDIIVEDPWKFDIEDASYDAVISGQMLEHNEFFWLTFLEMARVLKMGGIMVHIAPSRGLEHRDPQDCWRWYRDGMAAMAKWSGLEMLDATTDWAPEHFEYCIRRPKHTRSARRMRKTMRTENTVWGDTVGIFQKTQEVGDTIGMSYIRHFAALHPEKTAAE